MEIRRGSRSWRRLKPRYAESGATYLLYAVGGENSIAIARVDYTFTVGVAHRRSSHHCHPRGGMPGHRHADE